jgi:hypothetical protein
MKIGNLEVYGVIYKITNIVNGKIYIGQTIRGFDLRYKNNLEKHTNNKHLKSSIVKYGINNFKINTIFDIAFSEYELNIKEIIWIDYYDCRNNGYNIAEGGDSRKRTRISNIINNIKNKNLIYCKEEHRVYLSINDFCKIHNVKEKTLQSNVRSKRDTTIGDKKYNIVRIEDMSKLIYCTGIEQIFYNKADIQRYFKKV